MIAVAHEAIWTSCGVFSALWMAAWSCRMEHPSIQLTADRYGHLFRRGDDGAELA